MAAANAGRINYAELGPIDTSVLTQQPNHRSEAIWNGQVKRNTKSLTNVHAFNSYNVDATMSYINSWFCSVQDLGTLTCCSRSSEFSNREPMVDDRVVNIIKALGLEGLLWVLGREIDHGLITALVERWQLETYTFHMPYGEVNITLQDVEVILGLPVDGDAITGSTQKTWTEVCQVFLGFQPINQEQHKQLTSQRILIN